MAVAECGDGVGAVGWATQTYGAGARTAACEDLYRHWRQVGVCALVMVRGNHGTDEQEATLRPQPPRQIRQGQGCRHNEHALMTRECGRAISIPGRTLLCICINLHKQSWHRLCLRRGQLDTAGGAPSALAAMDALAFTIRTSRRRSDSTPWNLVEYGSSTPCGGDSAHSKLLTALCRPHVSAHAVPLCSASKRTSSRCCQTPLGDATSASQDSK